MSKPKSLLSKDFGGETRLDEMKAVDKLILKLASKDDIKAWKYHVKI